MCSDDLVGARYSQLEGGDEIRGLSSRQTTKEDIGVVATANEGGECFVLLNIICYHYIATTCILMQWVVLAGEICF